MKRAGIVTVAGKPNAGKSTMLNRIVGQKLSITSEKPQSTRDRIVGIRTTDDTQMVLLDTPGLLEPRYELQRVMRSTALTRARRRRRRGLRHRRDTRPTAEPRGGSVDSDDRRNAVITVLNKIDRSRQMSVGH